MKKNTIVDLHNVFTRNFSTEKTIKLVYRHEIFQHIYKFDILTVKLAHTPAYLRRFKLSLSISLNLLAFDAFLGVTLTHSWTISSGFSARVPFGISCFFKIL